MKLLLDTHVLLWILSERSKIPQQILDICSNPKNILYANLISLWEVQIKYQLGKLSLDVAVPDILKTAKENDILLLNLNESHILTLDSLPFYHQDPFDRLLIAQAKTEKLKFISADQKILQYDIEVLWK